MHVAAGTDLSTCDRRGQRLVTVQADDTILVASRAMVEADVRHLPVLRDRLIAGMVSMRDVVAVLSDAVSDEDVVVVPSGTRVVVRQD